MIRHHMDRGIQNSGYLTVTKSAIEHNTGGIVGYNMGDYIASEDDFEIKIIDSTIAHNDLEDENGEEY